MSVQRARGRDGEQGAFDALRGGPSPGVWHTKGEWSKVRSPEGKLQATQGLAGQVRSMDFILSTVGRH